MGGKVKNLDYILEHIVGGGGPWQWKTLFYFFPHYFISCVTLLIHLLTAFQPNHRCFVDICDSVDSNILANWTEFVMPADSDSSEFLSGTTEIDKCKMYPMIDPNGLCTKENFNFTGNKVACSAWQYDRSEFPATLVTELDLVCGAEPKRRFLSTIVMSGLLIGSIIGGRISDILGRTKTMYIATSIIAITTGISGLFSNYYSFVLLRLVSCISAVITWVAYFACIMEFFSANNHELLMSVAHAQGPLGILAQILVSYIFRDWTQGHIASGVLCLLPFLFWFWTPESIRWQVQNGQKDKAVTQLLIIAKGNNRILSKAQITEINEIMSRIEETALEKTEKKLSPFVMFKSGYLLTTSVLILGWVSVCVGSYTLYFSSSELSGNVFVNMALVQLTDLPAAFIMYICLRLFKRKTVTTSVFLFFGICCLTLAFMPGEQKTVILVIFLAGKLSAGIGFIMVWFITAELYPTNMRSQALGTCSMMARIAGLISPFVSALAVYWKPLPMLLLGSPLLLASGLSYLYLPETGKADLPQDLHEALELNNARK